MGSSPVQGGVWEQLSVRVAEELGLHFPADRRADLQRGIEAAAAELRFAGTEALSERVLSGSATPELWQALAVHLTVGETYFFRDPKTFEVLLNIVLPELIRLRRNQDRRLRLWSAGCCTGEEAYSLAIAVQRVLPDLAEWQVSILGTDINARSLGKAEAGLYGDWSFRDTPAGFKERHFTPAAGGRHRIRPEISKMVTFAPLNLVGGMPSPQTIGANTMDIVFCRNVLMYFAPAQARKAVATLHTALVEGGFLMVSPSEASQALFPQFSTLNFPGVIGYRKGRLEKPEPAPVAYAPLPAPPPAPVATPKPRQSAAAIPAAEKAPPTDFGRLARERADRGSLDEALELCTRWLAADKLDPVGHYLRAVVLLEKGQTGDARRSLEDALYVDSNFVLAHFALGNLERSRAHFEASDRHFANALRLLARRPQEEVLPESEGITAARLTEIITALAHPADLP